VLTAFLVDSDFKNKETHPSHPLASKDPWLCIKFF
jgi:hypothetical protein